MEELKDLGCKATVSGSNFGVTAGYMGAAHTPMTEEPKLVTLSEIHGRQPVVCVITITTQPHRAMSHWPTSLLELVGS